MGVEGGKGGFRETVNPALKLKLSGLVGPVGQLNRPDGIWTTCSILNKNK